MRQRKRQTERYIEKQTNSVLELPKRDKEKRETRKYERANKRIKN